MKINVLMSTYNGEKYLKEQIDSIGMTDPLTIPLKSLTAM